MCLAMNPDILLPQERCASTSNRNFEGCQGAGRRTHLMSPAMAAGAAIVGKLADVRQFALAEKDHDSPRVAMQADPEAIDDEDLEELDDVPADEQAANRSAPGAAGTSAGLPPFTTLKGIAAPIHMANIDTDAIIPKQFLKTIKRPGLGGTLFSAIRFHPDGFEKPDFVLNKEPYRHAKILAVTGPNFGCGSSREHAPWALLDFGVKCIIAPSFADIFYNNTFKNGMLPIAITDEVALQAIAREAEAGREIEVDLVNQVVKSDDGRVLAAFDVDEFRKNCLVKGLDDIGLTLQMEAKISAFEARRSKEWPWLDGSGYLKRHRPGPVKVAAAKVPTTNRGVDKEVADW